MQLWVVRHAIAAPAQPGQGDAERPLTAEGRAAFLPMAKSLASRPIRPNAVLASPFVRARQTAELLGATLGCPTSPCELLAEPPSAELLALLGAQDVALVGHEPWVSQLVAWLVFGRKELGERLPFERGAVAGLDGRPVPGGMTLRWFLAPDDLRPSGS
jgi:phosphohistidine phosphatase